MTEELKTMNIIERLKAKFAARRQSVAATYWQGIARLAEGRLSERAAEAIVESLDPAVATLGKDLDDVQADVDARLLRIPNVPADGVPEGKDDSENVEVKRWGEPRKFEFAPRDHVALAEAQGWLEIERAARISGSRNYVLKGDLSLLEGAVMRYALDLMVSRWIAERWREG
jgi:seryl-tRNA synthetase